jgi:hypothetical protein
MIAGRSGDDTSIPVGVAQREELIQGTARLERAGYLRALQLEVNLGSGLLAEPG